MCKLINEGGLGIRNLSKLNEAFDMKLGWDILHSHDAWAVLLRHKVIIQKKHNLSHLFFHLDQHQAQVLDDHG